MTEVWFLAGAIALGLTLLLVKAARSVSRRGVPHVHLRFRLSTARYHRGTGNRRRPGSR